MRFLVLIFSFIGFGVFGQDTLFRFSTSNGGKGDMNIPNLKNSLGLSSAVTGTGTTNTLAMFTGSNTIGNSPISTNGTILTSTQPLRVANGTTSSVGLQLGNATDGLYYNASNSLLYIQNTFGMVMESPFGGRQFNIGTSIAGAAAGLNVGGTQTPNLNLSGSNPKIYLRGDANSFDPEINFFGAAAGDAALGGAYAQISGNGGLIFKTAAASSVGLQKVGLTTGNEDFRYLQITTNLKGNNAIGGIGTAVSVDARYNNLNLLTFPHKPSGSFAAQNDYLGGIIGKADNTVQGDVPRASINFKYVGTNINDAAQQKYDIDFNIHSNGSGTYSYPFVNRFKIKDNGNIVLNGTLEIESPSTPPTMADDGKVLAYDNSVGRARLTANPSWRTTGNSGTTSGTNFIGTTDNQALDFRTNNVLRKRLTTTGRTENFGTNDNTFFGENSGNETATGTANVGYGERTLSAVTSGTDNVAMGYQALYNVQTGNYNIGIGRNAGRLVSGSKNVVVQFDEGNNGITIGSNNVVIGNGAGASIGSGTGNTALGDNAQITNGATNATAIGRGASANSSETAIAANNQNALLINNTTILPQNSRKFSGQPTTGMVGSDLISVTQAENTFTPDDVSYTVSTGMTGLALDGGNKHFRTFVVNTTTATTGNVNVTVSNLKKGFYILHFDNNSGTGTPTYVFSSNFRRVHTRANTLQNIVLAPNDGGTALRFYSDGTNLYQY